MSMLDIINPAVTSAKPSTIRAFNDFCTSVKCDLYLTLGQPDFDTPDVVTDATVKALRAHKTKYAPTYGTPALLSAISAYEKRMNKVDYAPDEILVTTGSTEAVATALMTILVPGDEVIVPLPAYPLYETLIEFMHATPVKMQTAKNHFQITREALEEAITPKTKAIIITSPNNPTGMILSDESLAAIHEAVKGKPVFVILDAVYDQLVYGPRRLGFSKYQDIRDQIIVCQSFSKPYAMPGWRIGYFMADRPLTTEAAKIHQAMIVCQNTFIQDGAIEALSFDPKPFLESYEARRDVCLSRLRAMGFEVDQPDGAFYVFPSTKKFGLSSQEFCERLAREEHVAVIPGDCFEQPDYFRISYCVAMDKIEDAMKRIGHFVSRL